MKRLDRLTPNLVYMCMSIWEWIFVKQFAPRDTRRHLGGFRGVKHSKVSGSCQTGLVSCHRLDRLATHSVHVCGFIWEWTYAKNNSPHDTLRRHFGGGVRGSTIQKTGKCGQTAGPIGTQFCTYNADESGNGHRLNKLAP